MSRLREKAEFKATVAKLQQLFTSPASEETFAGAPADTPLEHVTRKHFIDPFLEALGWDLGPLNEQVVEEARTHGETTLRLDYLGISTDARAPLAIVEAKPWSARYVSPAGGTHVDERDEPLRIGLLIAAIEHRKANGALEDSPVSQEWAKIIDALVEYVTNVRGESGHIVQRVAITSGNWLITFTDPKAVFLTPNKAHPTLIKVYRGNEILERSDEIFEALARCVLTEVVPKVIRPAQLSAFTRGNEIRYVYRALWVTHSTSGAHFRPRPTIDFHAATVLERKDSVLLTVVDQSQEAQIQPHDAADLGEHIADVRRLSDALLALINTELRTTFVPSDVTAFPGFPRAMAARGGARVDLLKSFGSPNEFLLVTGTAAHFLLPAPNVDPCAGHSWAACQVLRCEMGFSPVLSRSVTPRSFFTSTELHHCAHRTVHDRRDARCQIDPFEAFLCCRACALESFCWPRDDLASLPCGIGAAHAAA